MLRFLYFFSEARPIEAPRKTHFTISLILLLRQLSSFQNLFFCLRYTSAFFLSLSALYDLRFVPTSNICVEWHHCVKKTSFPFWFATFFLPLHDSTDLWSPAIRSFRARLSRSGAQSTVTISDIFVHKTRDRFSFTSKTHFRSIKGVILVLSFQCRWMMAVLERLGFKAVRTVQVLTSQPGREKISFC